VKQLLFALWTAVVAVGVVRVAQGAEVAHPVASPHPYQNDMDASTQITHPGATSLRLHFRRIDVEEWFDTLYVYDANGQVVAEYSGAHDDVWTPSIAGDTARVQLVSDRSITGFGFDLDRIDVVQPPPTGVDAVMNRGNHKAYFFQGSEYTRFDLAKGQADAGYPRKIARGWRGVWPDGVDAAVSNGRSKVYFFKGAEYVRYDLGTDRVDRGYPRPIRGYWPGLWADGVDAAMRGGADELIFFRGEEYLAYDLANDRVTEGPAPISSRWAGVFPRDVGAAFKHDNQKSYVFKAGTYTRFAASSPRADAGYPRVVKYRWPGLWDPKNGTGHPGANLPAAVARLLEESPSAAEIEARHRRAARSVSSKDTNLSSRYPLYLASIERRLKAYGAQIVRRSVGSYRFRCATNTAGPQRIDIPRLVVDHIDWSNAKYHIVQRSQGDFMADAGTPLTILKADNDEFFIDKITANKPTGSISSGLNIRVRFYIRGVKKRIGFSHLNTAVPRYVFEAKDAGTSLPTGTVFGFIGYTGNLWMGAPPATDRAYRGNGHGLPAAHSHLWFAADPANHKKLTTWAREALDYSGTYTFGGG